MAVAAHRVGSLIVLKIADPDDDKLSLEVSAHGVFIPPQDLKNGVTLTEADLEVVKLALMAHGLL